MSKKMNLNLEELKVQSFVTQSGKLAGRDLKGGLQWTIECFTLHGDCSRQLDCTCFECSEMCTDNC